jgi:hypothetical protein
LLISLRTYGKPGSKFAGWRKKTAGYAENKAVKNLKQTPMGKGGVPLALKKAA